MSESPLTTRALLVLLCPCQQRRITAHIAQLKATLVNNASCSSDLTLRNVKKTGFILAFMKHTQKPSKRKLPRDLAEAIWQQSRTMQRSQAAENLGNGMDVSLGCFSQTEQQSITATKCCGNQSTKEVKLPHWEVQTEIFWCFPGSRDRHPLQKLQRILPSGITTNTNKLAKQTLLLKSG